MLLRIPPLRQQSSISPVSNINEVYKIHYSSGGATGGRGSCLHLFPKIVPEICANLMRKILGRILMIFMCSRLNSMTLILQSGMKARLCTSPQLLVDGPTTALYSKYSSMSNAWGTLYNGRALALLTMQCNHSGSQEK